ncbi:MAG: DUF3014 domain-containing protein, partial [Pseudomonadota bacterium]
RVLAPFGIFYTSLPRVADGEQPFLHISASFPDTSPRLISDDPSEDFILIPSVQYTSALYSQFHSYQPYREILDSLDPARLVDLYFEYQPAFEQAWIDLGMVDTDFQSRLIEVIDHLLAFEPPEQVPQLIRPEVLYEFSDPALEQASWGHKLLMRIGPEHSNAVQQKLAAVRAELLNGAENTAP